MAVEIIFVAARDKQADSGTANSARTLEVMVVDQRIRSTSSRNSVEPGKPNLRGGLRRGNQTGRRLNRGEWCPLSRRRFFVLVKRASVRVPPTSMSTVHKIASRRLRLPIS